MQLLLSTNSKTLQLIVITINNIRQHPTQQHKNCHKQTTRPYNGLKLLSSTFNKTLFKNIITIINKQRDLLLQCNNSPCCIGMSCRRSIGSNPNIGITAQRGTSSNSNVGRLSHSSMQRKTNIGNYNCRPSSCYPSIGIDGSSPINTNTNIGSSIFSLIYAYSKVGNNTRRATGCNPNFYLLVSKVLSEVLLFVYNSSKKIRYIVVVYF